MSDHPLRKIIQKTGFDIHRHHPAPDKEAFLAKLGIKTVLDIGANIGQFAHEIRKILPDAFIYSFEPLKDCYGELTRSMSGDPYFKAFNYAIGENTEDSVINKSSYAPSSSLLKMSSSHKTLFPHTAGATAEKIEVKKLDDILNSSSLKKEILIKIDTQGYEDKVIRGGTSMFYAARAALIETSFVELYGGQPLFDDIYMLMKSLGYAYKGASQEKVDPKTGEIISEDSIFVRK